MADKRNLQRQESQTLFYGEAISFGQRK